MNLQHTTSFDSTLQSPLPADRGYRYLRKAANRRGFDIWWTRFDDATWYQNWGWRMKGRVHVKSDQQLPFEMYGWLMPYYLNGKGRLEWYVEERWLFNCQSWRLYSPMSPVALFCTQQCVLYNTDPTSDPPTPC